MSVNILDRLHFVAPTIPDHLAPHLYRGPQVAALESRFK